MGKSGPDCTPESIRYRTFLLGENIGCRCRCATSLSPCSRIVDLAMVISPLILYPAYTSETVKVESLYLARILVEV